jgi:HPt (histidine-containing phosphotransfer) domain-containing protein
MPTSEIDKATFQELKQMSGADFIGELVDTFLEDAPKLIAELKAALNAGDAEAFRRAAHSLKSNGATFGAMHLSQLAKDLEMIGKENRLGDTGERIAHLESAWASASAELKGLRA